MIRRVTARLAVLTAVAAMVLAGSSTTPPRPAAEPLTGSSATRFLQGLDRFEVKGRVAGAVGSEGFNAQLDWQQRKADSKLVLRSPLGFGSATVETDGNELRFQSSRGEKASGEAALQALNTRLGFEPPLRSLRYWLLGVADPSGPSVEQIGVAGAPAAFQQFGWQVTAAEPRPVASPKGAVSLPRRVTIERAPVRLRVVVDGWTLE
ncbi:MAG: outer membrane lipoprotein LolB [Steroidobacteraceae bacterium]